MYTTHNEYNHYPLHCNNHHFSSVARSKHPQSTYTDILFEINFYEIHKNTFENTNLNKCFKRLSYSYSSLWQRESNLLPVVALYLKLITTQSSWKGNSLQGKNKTILTECFLQDFLVSNLSLTMIVTTICICNLPNNSFLILHSNLILNQHNISNKMSGHSTYFWNFA